MKKRFSKMTGAEKVLVGACALALFVLGASAWKFKGGATRQTGAIIGTVPWRLVRARVRMASALVGNELWVLGGIGSGLAARSDAESFDLESTPHQKRFGAMSSAVLAARTDHTAEAVGPDIFLFGGLTNKRAVLGLGEKLDTRTGRVTLLAPMPTPRRMAHSAVSGGKIYVVGGSVSSTRGNLSVKRVGTLEVYDIASNTWARAAPMRVAREADVALWHGQLIVTGGYDGVTNGDGVLSAVESFDLKTGVWKKLPGLSRPVSAHHVTVSGDWLFLWGDYRSPQSVLAYNARTGQSKDLKGTGFAARRHCETVSFGNRVFVVGGNTDDLRAPTDEVQVFDVRRLKKLMGVRK